MIVRLTLAVLALTMSLQACSNQNEDFIEFTTVDCLIRVEYKNGNKFGLLKFTSNRKSGEIGWCETNVESIQTSLELAIRKLVASHSENILTSVQVGQLSNYPWIRDDLEKMDVKQRGVGRYNLNEYLKVNHVLEPISRVLENYGWVGQTAQCEKAEYDDTGMPIDGFCWLKVEKQP